MIIIYRRVILAFFLGVLFMFGVLLSYHYQKTHVKMGNHYVRINPFAKINPQKDYYLELWDYDWPGYDYKHRLKQAIAVFQQTYPNIHVKVRLLDFIGGESILKMALEKRDGPDVYSSVYSVPSFNYRCQIPVGPFLNDEEKNCYYSPISRFSYTNEIFCSFPRWSALNIWLANPNLIGDSIRNIQNEGWNWSDLKKISESLPNNTYVWSSEVEPLSENGFLGSLKVNGLNGGNNDLQHCLALLAELQKEKKISIGSGDMIGQFINGKTALIGGIRPVLYRKIRKLLINKKIMWSPVVLPYPRIIRDKEIQPVEISMISIYRNRRTKGEDHLAAAVKLGQFLSKSEHLNSFWEEVGLFPADKNYHSKSNEYQLYRNRIEKAVLLNLDN